MPNPQTHGATPQTAARDPRKDPQSCDVVRLINGVEVAVGIREPEWVYAHMNNGRRVKIAIDNWQRDCEHAEVLHVAE